MLILASQLKTIYCNNHLENRSENLTKRATFDKRESHYHPFISLFERKEKGHQDF